MTTGKGAKIFDQDDVQEPAENADIVTFQFLDNGNVWGDYDASAHGIVEAAFQDWVKDPTVSLRPVKSGQACYVSVCVCVCVKCAFVLTVACQWIYRVDFNGL